MVPIPIGKWQWIAGWAVMLLIIAAWVLMLARRIPQFVVSSIAAVLPADGREHAVWRVARSDGGPVEGGQITAEAIGGSGRDDVGDARIVQTGKEPEGGMEGPVQAAESPGGCRWGGRG